MFCNCKLLQTVFADIACFLSTTVCACTRFLSVFPQVCVGRKAPARTICVQKLTRFRFISSKHHMNLLSLLHRLWYNEFKWTGGCEGSPSPAFPMFRLTQYHRSVFTMRKKQCVAMLLAGGQGSRLGILTKDVAKPAVHGHRSEHQRRNEGGRGHDHQLRYQRRPRHAGLRR